jgi:Predicted transcriptional regulators
MPRQQTPLSIEYILLGFLEKSPIHGYDLYKKITTFEAISLVWNLKQSQLYALLDRLEAAGLIASTLIPGEAHPDRKQYHLTESGRKTFYAWRDNPVQHGRDIRMEFLAKLYFALNSSPEKALDLIDEQKANCVSWLTIFRNDVLNTAEDQFYEKIVFSYRASQIEATLDWLETTRKEIRAQLQPIQFKSESRK